MSRECIGCGCTDVECCDGGCQWAHVTGDFGICSNCVDAFDDPVARLSEATAGGAPRWENDDGDEYDDDSGLILPGVPEYLETLRGGR
jgi:hypothetical protein